MKRNTIIALIAIVTLLTIVGCSSATQSNDQGGKHFNLDFATFWPSEDFQVAEGHQAWAKEIKSRVEAETTHTIDINFHTSGVLLGATEIYEGVANGAADLGSTSPSYTPGVFRATSAFELPGFRNDNALVASLTIQEAFNTYEELQKEYKDVKVMHFWATGPGDLITTRPVNTLEDVRGLEIRVAGGSVPAIEALGATPVSMPMGESYLALNSGIVRGILGPTDIMKGFKLAEVTNHVVKTPYLYNIVFVKVMNKKTWDSLPSEVQKIFDEVNAKYVYEYGKLRAEATKAGLQYAIDNYGHTVVTLTPEEEARWINAISQVQQKWIDDMTKNGLPAQNIIDKVKELDEKFSNKHGNDFK